MIKISDLKKSILELNREQQKIEKNNLRLVKEKEKLVNKNIKNLFLESIQEITWRIEVLDGKILFLHDRDWVQKAYFKPTKSKNKITLKKSRAVGMTTMTSRASRINSSFDEKESIYKKKFGKLFRFLEDNFDSPAINFNGLHITMTYEGFIIPIAFLESFSFLELEKNYESLNNFIAKTKIKLNLEAFNEKTELLEKELELRKKFLHRNSNAFLFGL